MRAWRAIVADGLAGARADGLLPLTLAAGGGALLLAPALGGTALFAVDRATADLALALAWATTALTGLRLGSQAPGLASGEAVLILAGPVGTATWITGRLTAAAVVLAAQASALHLGLLALGPLRDLGPGLLAAAAAAWAEGCFLAAAAALLTVWTRPWLGALLAGVLGAAAHLVGDLADALSQLGAEGLVPALVVVPSLDVLAVRGALAAGQPVPLSLAAALLHVLAWSVALTGGTVLSMARRDRT